MIEVPIKTIWQGKVGVNEERYIKEAHLTNQGLCIKNTDTGEVMIISADKLFSSQIARSDRKFKDKYGFDDYYLIYYKWQPTARQGSLLL